MVGKNNLSSLAMHLRFQSTIWDFWSLLNEYTIQNFPISLYIYLISSVHV